MKPLYLILLFGLISSLKVNLLSSPQIKRDNLILEIKKKISKKFPANYQKLGDVRSCEAGAGVLLSFVSAKNAENELKYYKFPKKIEKYIITANSTVDTLLNYNINNNGTYEHSIVATSRVETSEGDYIVFIVIHGRAVISKKLQNFMKQKVECTKIPKCIGPSCKKCKVKKYRDTRQLLPYELSTLYKAADVCINKEIEKRLKSFNLI